MFESSLDDISKLAQIALGIIGIYAIYISHNQLKLSQRNTQLNIAKNEIDIFAKLNEKERVFIDYLEQFDETQTGELHNIPETLLRAKQEYLRLLNTVCLYVLNESITLDNFRNQYKETVDFIIKRFDNDFGKDSLYKNIIKVYNNKL